MDKKISENASKCNGKRSLLIGKGKTNQKSSWIKLDAMGIHRLIKLN